MCGLIYRRLLLLFDAVYVAVDAALSVCKYAVHAVDHYQGARAEARGQVRSTHRQPACWLLCMRQLRPWQQLSLLLCLVSSLIVSYFLLLVSCYSHVQEREPWEGRSELVYWLDLASDLALQTLTLAHHLHLW